MELKQALADLTDTVRGALANESHARQKLEARLNQLRDSLEQYTRQLPAHAGGGTARDPDYNGFWPNEKMAEDFGHLVLACVHPVSDQRIRSAEHVAKGGYTFRRTNGTFAQTDDFVKAMGIGGDTAGGYLVPDEFAKRVIRNVDRFGVFRRNVTVVPMSRERQAWPKRTGGFTVYYPDEGVAPTASDLALGAVTLTAKKWAVLTFFSKEIEDDAVIALGELLALEIALAIAQAEDRNGFLGDGTSTYAGIVGVLKSPNVTVVTMGNGETEFSNVAYSSLIDLAFAVPSWVHDMPDTSYVMSPYVIGLLMRLVDGSGRPLFQPAREAFPMEIAGYPVRKSSVLPGLTESGPSTEFIAFGSLKAWGMLGQRRALQIERSVEVKWLEDQVAVKAVPRQDIQEADGQAMAVLKTAAS